MSVQLSLKFFAEKGGNFFLNLVVCVPSALNFPLLVRILGKKRLATLLIAGFFFLTGLCPVAIGSDGGGSIRIPSAACGIVGVKGSS